MRRSWISLATLLLLAACGSGGSDPVQYAAEARGGAGSAGPGGNGGGVAVYSFGPVSLETSGGLPALPAVPGWGDFTPDLGTNPLTIAADTALTVGATLLGDDGATPATGLSVAGGATLTLTPESGIAVSIALPADLLVEGTLATAQLPGSLDAASLSVSAANVWVRGALQTSGGDAPAGASGGKGGALTLNATGTGGMLLLGKVVTSGGAGDVGGAGGVVSGIVVGPHAAPDVTPAVLAVAGLVDTSGGAGLAGAGGAAGGAVFQGDMSNHHAVLVSCSGELRARGGDGTAGGGSGGPVALISAAAPAVSTATLDASGGAATVSGAGGAGHVVQIAATDGIGYVGGTLRTRGGASVAGPGGNGGMAVAMATTVNDASAETGLYVAADLSTDGGAGVSGGNGGVVQLVAQSVGPCRGVLASGYRVLDASGGAGLNAGGAANQVVVSQIPFLDSGLGGYVASPVVVQATLVADGGAATAGNGGPGGAVGVQVPLPGTLVTTASSTVSGTLRARGGDGTAAGGAGGLALVSDPAAVLWSGTVDVSGGAAGTDDGGAGGHVQAASQESSGAITLSATVTALGGASAGAMGGLGGTLTAVANAVTCGPVTADGGASAAPAGTGGTGGSAILKASTPPTQVTGLLSLRGGAGATPGAAGTLQLDGAAVPLTDGQYTP